MTVAITSLLRGTEALDATALRQRLREPLAALLRFDGYCMNTCDPSSGVITSSVGDGLPPRRAQRLFELEARGGDFHSLSALFTASDPVARLSEATGGDVLRSVRMREVLGPLGYVDELRAALRARGACWGYLHLLRKGSAFTAAEAERVRKVAPLIGDALRRAASRPGAASIGATSVVLLEAEKSELLGEAVGLDAIESGADVPHAARAVGELARVRGSASSVAQARDGRWLKLSAVKHGRGAAVVIAPAAGDDALEVSFAAAGLTAREREVARLIASGAGNAQIAADLGVTLHTAKDHVKAVLRKTGAKRRGQLAGSLLRRVSER